MKRIGQILEKMTDLISGHLQGWLLCLLMVLILVEVATRYVLQNPLSVAEEYGGYILVAIVFIGLAYTWKERSHVRVTLLTDRLPLKAQLALRLITVLIAAVLAGFMVVASWQLVDESLMFGDRSGSWLRTPLAWPQMVLILGSALLLLQLIVEVFKAWTNLKAGEGEV